MGGTGDADGGEAELSPAMLRWRRAVRKLRRLAALRRIWSALGGFLKNFTELKAPIQPKARGSK